MTKKATPIYFESDGISTYFWRRRDGSTAAKLASSACTAKYDQFLVELVTDPMSGTLSLIGYGACVGGLGTRGAAWYYANVMLPDRMKYPDSWYVFEWTDGDGDGQAGMKDTFKILASGK
jgi:hypothetical protein